MNKDFKELLEKTIAEKSKQKNENKNITGFQKPIKEKKDKEDENVSTSR